MTKKPELPSGARELLLEHLPSSSPWPERLLRSLPTKQRDRKEVLREYDTEKWGRALQLLQQQTTLPDQNDILRAQGLDVDQSVAFSRDRELYTAPLSRVLQCYLDWLVQCLHGFQTECVVELGCGLGDKLLWIQRQLKIPRAWGGELTSAGVATGQFLAERYRQQAQFAPFDFQNPGALAEIPNGALVYTSHAIEQVPQLTAQFVDVLIQRKPVAILHFEPCYECLREDSLLDLMCKRYAEVNDYNRNLRSLLQASQARGAIELLHVQPDAFGINPFNPTTFYAWRPRP